MSNWAKMADDLDRNRKIRKGGRNAREVFLWVLRKVASSNTSGWIKAEDFDDLEYLADELMAPVTDVTDGVTRCIEVGLLVRDEDKVCISGWSGHWAVRKPLSNGERQQRHRDSKKSGTSTKQATSTVTESRYAVTNSVTSNESNVGEERRGKERERERESARELVETKPVKAAPTGPGLATKIWDQHTARHAAINARLGLGLPGLLPPGHAVGWRDLRDRIASFAGDLERAEQACLHVLDVREAETLKRRDLKYFGDKVWREDQFTHALAEKRPAGARASPATATATTAELPDEFTPDLSWLPTELFQ